MWFVCRHHLDMFMGLSWTDLHGRLSGLPRYEFRYNVLDKWLSTVTQQCTSGHWAWGVYGAKGILDYIIMQTCSAKWLLSRASAIAPGNSVRPTTSRTIEMLVFDPPTNRWTPKTAQFVGLGTSKTCQIQSESAAWRRHLHSCELNWLNSFPRLHNVERPSFREARCAVSCRRLRSKYKRETY